MSLAVAWLVFPVLLGLACLGAGLLVERITAAAMRGPLLLPVGFAALVVVTQALTFWDWTAEAAMPAALGVAAAGLAFGWRRVSPRGLDLWAAAAAAFVFAVFAAPVALSGEPTFAGYTLLGDTSIHFSLIDHVMEHGRDVSGLTPSSYQAAVRGYLETSYPTGAHTVLGAFRPLVGQDVAWVYQPYLAFLAALICLCLYSLAGSLVESRPLRAAVAAIAAQPALVLAYSLQGSIKELATVLILAMAAGLAPLAVERPGIRSVFPLALTTAAGLCVLTAGVAPWLGPVLLAYVVVLAWQHGRPAWRSTLRKSVAFGVLTVALAWPALALTGTFIEDARPILTNDEEVGNLFGSLERVQIFGIWPAGDYRFDPSATSLDIAHVLIAVTAIAALLGMVLVVRRRSLQLLVYVGATAVGLVYTTWQGSPWVDAKGLMIASPAVMLLAMLGSLGWLAERPAGGQPVAARRRWPLLASGFAAFIAAGVLWSNALAYHDVDLAPRARLAELNSIGKRIDDRGPTLYVEFEEFAKHFLRRSDPTGSAEYWQPATPVNPTPGRFGFSQDMDSVALDYVQRFRTLVLRRSPSLSRPPATYRLVESGRYYEAWERGPRGRITAHVPLNEQLQPAAPPSCRELSVLGRRARAAGGRLAYVARPASHVALPTRSSHPPFWRVDGEDPLSLRPSGQGRLETSVAVEADAEYLVWLQGSFGRAVAVSIDGRRVGDVSDELNPRGQYAFLTKLPLTRGTHSVVLERGGGNLEPGDGGANRLIGPVVFEPSAATPRTVAYASPTRQRVEALCRMRLDWVELVD